MFSKEDLGRALAAVTSLVMLAAALPLAASAQAPGVAHRLQRQQQRINQGRSSGQLTRGEYRVDESRLRQIEQQRRAYLKGGDGKLTAAQREKLNDELNHNSRTIYFTKHNFPTQPGVKRPGYASVQKLPSPNSPRYIADRVSRQMDRIHNGMVSGQLSRGEYGRDLNALQAIERQRAAWMKAQGGKLTEAQETALNQRLGTLNQQIWNTKHNSKDQPGV